jgi:basic amino acid/polyamine antiporter, APA family
MATIGILGSHFAGDFFLGIDIMVTSMLVNFMLMCLSVVMLPTHNPVLASQISVFKSRGLQLFLGVSGTILLTAFLIIHITKDMNANVSAWYFHSTPRVAECDGLGLNPLLLSIQQIEKIRHRY